MPTRSTRPKARRYGTDCLAMFDALVTMMDVQGFWELKRTRTERPEFGERP